MTRRVVWSESASKELENQVRYILQRNKDAALKMAKIIRESGNKMAERPIGRPGSRPGTYERVLPGSPYILVFSLEAHTVTILHVFYEAQNWQSLLSEEADEISESGS